MRIVVAWVVLLCSLGYTTGVAAEEISIEAFAPPPPQAYFASEADWAAYAVQRVNLLAGLEEGVREQGRTRAFTFKRLLSVSAILVGALALTAGFDGAVDSTEEQGHATTAMELVCGAALASVGIPTTIMLWRRRPYRRQELTLRAERLALEHHLEILGVPPPDYRSSLAPARQAAVHLARHVPSFWQRAELQLGGTGAQLRVRF